MKTAFISVVLAVAASSVSCNNRYGIKEDSKAAENHQLSRRSYFCYYGPCVYGYQPCYWGWGCCIVTKPQNTVQRPPPTTTATNSTTVPYSASQSVSQSVSSSRNAMIATASKTSITLIGSKVVVVPTTSASEPDVPFKNTQPFIQVGNRKTLAPPVEEIVVPSPVSLEPDVAKIIPGVHAVVSKTKPVITSAKSTATGFITTGTPIVAPSLIPTLTDSAASTIYNSVNQFALLALVLAAMLLVS